jgi:hemolysin activation/secretion protein
MLSHIHSQTMDDARIMMSKITTPKKPSWKLASPLGSLALASAMPLLLLGSAWAQASSLPPAAELEIAEPAASDVVVQRDNFIPVGAIPLDWDGLMQAINSWTGRPLSGADFERLVSAVGDHLRAAGHAQAKVTVLRDRAAGGKLTIRLENLSPTPAAYAAVPATQPTLSFRAIKVEAVDGISSDEFDAAVKPWVGRAVSAAQIDEAAAAVTAVLKGKGFSLAQAYVPPQSVSDGVLNIGVLRGVVDGSVGQSGIIVKGAERIDASVIAQALSEGAPAGEPLRIDALEQSVLLANELPGLKLRANLVPGSRVGTTAIEAQVQEERTYAGVAYVDNYGNRYSGEARLGADISLFSPAGRGDLLSLGGVFSERSSAFKGAWSMPTGWRNSRAGLSLSGSRVSLTPQIIDARFDGQSTTVGLFGQLPLRRTAREAMDLVGALEFKSLKNEFEDMIFDRRSVQALSGALNGVDGAAFGDGRAQWNAGLTVGQVEIQDRLISLNPRLDTEGGFSRLNADYRLERALNLPEGAGKGWSYGVRAAGQASLGNNNLDNAEKYQVGGPEGVRAYAVGEGHGDSGVLMSLEVGRALEVSGPVTSARVFAFYDYGQVTRHKFSSQSAEASDGLPNTYRLQGAGLGLRIVLDARSSLQLVAAAPVGDNPSQVKGVDTDNRKSETRFWLTGRFEF